MHTGELTMTYAAYRKITLSHQTASLWVLRVLGIIALAWLMPMILIGVVTANVVTADAVAAVAMGLALLTGHEVAALVSWQPYRRLAAEGPFRYELTPDAVRVTTSQIDIAVTWSGISRVTAYRACWLLRVAAGDRPLPLPRAAFPADRHDEITAFLRERTRRRSH